MDVFEQVYECVKELCRLSGGTGEGGGCELGRGTTVPRGYWALKHPTKVGAERMGHTALNSVNFSRGTLFACCLFELKISGNASLILAFFIVS